MIHSGIEKPGIGHCHCHTSLQHVGVLEGQWAQEKSIEETWSTFIEENTNQLST